MHHHDDRRVGGGQGDRGHPCPSPRGSLAPGASPPAAPPTCRKGVQTRRGDAQAVSANGAPVLGTQPPEIEVGLAAPEQVFILSRQEVPYSVAVTVDSFAERPRRGKQPESVLMEATIHVEKESQKRILVGHGGAMIREIGARARHHMTELLGRPAHLKLFVRVTERWTELPSSLREMGYSA